MADTDALKRKEEVSEVAPPSSKRSRSEPAIPPVVSGPTLVDILGSMSDAGFLLDQTRLVLNHVATLLLRADVGQRKMENFTNDVAASLGKMADALEEPVSPAPTPAASAEAVKKRLVGYLEVARGLARLVAGEVESAEKLVGAERTPEVRALREQLEKFAKGERSKRSSEIVDSVRKSSSEPAQKRAKLDESAAKQGDAGNDVEAWLAEFVNCNRTSVKSVREGVSQVAHVAENYYAPPAKASRAAAAPSDAGIPPLHQKVFFITNRKFDARKNSYTGDDQDKLDFGNTTVSIPQILDDGKLRQEGDKVKFYVSAERTQRQPSVEPFLAEVSKDLASAPRKEILLFIHGYNVKHNDAMGALGMLVKDIAFSGPAIALDWASNGKLSLYGSVPFVEDDKERVKSSAPLFADILKKLIDSLTGVEKVHILAHSMGNFLLQQILEKLKNSVTADTDHPFRKVHTLIFAAADISVQEAQNALDNIQKVKPPNSSGHRNMTVYCSTGDLALLVSSLIQRGPRIGFFTEGKRGNHKDHPFYHELVETVEVVDSDLDAVGHSYYSYDSKVLNDIKTLIDKEGEGTERLKASKCTSNPLCIKKLWRVPKVQD